MAACRNAAAVLRVPQPCESRCRPAPRRAMISSLPGTSICQSPPTMDAVSSVSAPGATCALSSSNADVGACARSAASCVRRLLHTVMQVTPQYCIAAIPGVRSGDEATSDWPYHERKPVSIAQVDGSYGWVHQRQVPSPHIIS